MQQKRLCSTNLSLKRVFIFARDFLFLSLRYLLIFFNCVTLCRFTSISHWLDSRDLFDCASSANIPRKDLDDRVDVAHVLADEEAVMTGVLVLVELSLEWRLLPRHLKVAESNARHLTYLPEQSLRVGSVRPLVFAGCEDMHGYIDSADGVEYVLGWSLPSVLDEVIVLCSFLSDVAGNVAKDIGII